MTEEMAAEMAATEAYIREAGVYSTEANAAGDLELAATWLANQEQAQVHLAALQKQVADAEWINAHHHRQALERQLAAEARLEGEIIAIDREVAGGCRTVARWRQLTSRRAVLARELQAVCS